MTGIKKGVNTAIAGVNCDNYFFTFKHYETCFNTDTQGAQQPA
jgi:hypothetical protein